MSRPNGRFFLRSNRSLRLLERLSDFLSFLLFFIYLKSKQDVDTGPYSFVDRPFVLAVFSRFGLFFCLSFVCLLSVLSVAFYLSDSSVLASRREKKPTR